MRAIVYDRYGDADVLRLEDVAAPVAGDSDVLVRVHATSINPYDWHFMTGVPYFMRLLTGLRKPKKRRLGLDFAGEVEEVGKDVKELRRGDAVYGMADGAFAEYVSVPAKHVARAPANLTFEQAASLPLAGVTALQGLRDAGKVEAGQKVLVIGAGGGIGTLALQLAKHFGAHVTGVCGTDKLELVRKLGADAVIDYTREDFTEKGERYDVVFELAGDTSPRRLRRALTPAGTLVLSSGDSDGRWLGPMGRIALGAAMSPLVSQTIVSLSTKRSGPDQRYLTELVEAGKLETVVSETHELSEIAEAMRSFERAHVRGKIVVKVPA